ncbi:L-seryl-tRNA(Sec) selenium transferase [Clostridium estertheticum]|uniref:L-seryl-tRNA(Sec) selenium transferase n=1 Tax=Clostridium estertheticum TaxID=238834 RepID=UPI0013EE5B2A|nr:L-seryl-tRNA(Sec) selenium transferase [Clostridium estertheticum]MBZ9607222.1 L-seryl-tRNA(Sec) selenium transferase [Clostridium estertheticum]
MEKNLLLRKLPKIDGLLNEAFVIDVLLKTSRVKVVDALRETIDLFRKNILSGDLENFETKDILQQFKRNIEEKKSVSLKKIINCTGVIIHTNLGRSRLSKNAVEGVLNIANNYSNLEYNLADGKRGSRYSHVEDILTKITGAEAALVVNNNAAAVLLTLNTLCSGKEAIVSRGQLVEIGGSFRIPDVMRFSGAKLIEVGTTNRTHPHDYESNINENTGVLLKVHTSNFKILGYTLEVPNEELVEIGLKNDIPVIEDIGSGTLVDFSKYGFTHEPTVQESVKKGVDVITFSGDKMLGGPQAGIIVGKKKYIDMMKKNQLTRALRIDKMTLAALEGTLKYYFDENEAVENIPTLYMILSSKELHKKRALKLKRKLNSNSENFTLKVCEDFSMVGGGSMPEARIATFVIKVKSSNLPSEEIEKRLRLNKVPIIVRVSNDEVILDLRTIADNDFEVISEAFKKMDLN